MSFKIYLPSVAQLDHWEPIDEKYEFPARPNGHTAIYLAGELNGKHFSVEMGFDKTDGAYVKLWDDERDSHGIKFCGRFCVEELRTLRKLAG